ncbi:MAG: TIGR02584 family CRISPR-associated protein [Deltaproteobacteria bacterium]|nr:TIGR02584 family CRISPR-associated protein [Deltaproteobacteria bacterium]
MGHKAYREILVFVAGTTPQIITETLYGLVFEKDPPILPDEIHIITTQPGKSLIERELFQKGRLEAFFKEFDLEPIPVEKVHIIVVQDPYGDHLDDIREAHHNEAVGDLIAEFIKEKARDPASRLHCSMAGGRKTMSFYLGSALQLFGRAWDRLYHVLVTPEFESHPDFYYKPKEDRILEVKDVHGNRIRVLNTRDASITLAELPFIRLRNKLSLESMPFRELVAEGQRDLDAAMVQQKLEVNLQARRVRIGSNSIEMLPVQLMLYCAFLREKIQRCHYPNRLLCLDCTDCFRALVDLAGRHALEAMAQDYKRIYGPRLVRIENLLDKWKEGFDVEALRQHVSKINRTLKEGMGDETLAPFYMVTTVGKHGSKRYGVRAERGKIRII